MTKGDVLWHAHVASLYAVASLSRKAGAPVSWRRRWRLLDRGSILASGAMSLASPAWANVCKEKWSRLITSPRCWLWVSFCSFGAADGWLACRAARACRVTENMSNSDPHRRNWWQPGSISYIICKYFLCCRRYKKRASYCCKFCRCCVPSSCPCVIL